MEKIKSMARDFILKTVEQNKQPQKEPNRHILIAEKLLHTHKMNEQMPWEGELEDSEWKTICRVCFDIVKYKELKTMKEYLVNNVISDAIRHGGSMDDVNFSRATINGIELFMEEIERLANLYQAEMQDAKEGRLEDLLDNVYEQ